MLAQKPGTVLGIDISAKAVKLARENLRRNARHVQASVSFKQVDLYSDNAAALVSCADVVVANPPYIDIDNQAGITISTRRYEPTVALMARDKGDAFYKRIADMLEHSHARFIALEIGSAAQAERVRKMLPQFTIETWLDAAGLQRVVVGRRTV